MNTAIWTLADWIFSARAPEGARVKDDRALIKGILAHGAEECFDRLVERYKDKVFRLAVSVLGPGCDAEAEDVTQEVFLQVFRKLSTFRGESGFSTWLYRITYNQALERRRRAPFRLPHQGEEALAALVAPVEEADPVIKTMKRQRRRIVLEALARLDEPYRTAIHLYYWMKLSVGEIAGQLETRPGTVKSYLYRGRERLAKILGEEQEDG
jgi:RNA polymerase sigma-70 factor (ECF subfamily)